MRKEQENLRQRIAGLAKTPLSLWKKESFGYLPGI
jgi:hypothetical protein